MQRAHMKHMEEKVAHVKMAKEDLEKWSWKKLKTVEHSVLRLLLIHRVTESNKGYSCHTAGSSLSLQGPSAESGSAAQRAATPTLHILCNAYKGGPSKALAKKQTSASSAIISTGLISSLEIVSMCITPAYCFPATPFPSNYTVPQTPAMLGKGEGFLEQL